MGWLVLGGLAAIAILIYGAVLLRRVLDYFMDDPKPQ